MSIKHNLNQFIDHLIVCEASKSAGQYKLNYDDLDNIDKGQIVQFILELSDRDLFSVYENKNYDLIVSELIKYIGNQSTENGLELAASLRDNIFSYYAKRIQELIDDRCALLDADELYANGYFHFLDRDTGEYEDIRL